VFRAAIFYAAPPFFVGHSPHPWLARNPSIFCEPWFLEQPQIKSLVAGDRFEA